MATKLTRKLDFAKMFPEVLMSFHPGHDYQETEQTGGLDLCKAVATRTVPGQVADNLLPANCLAEPGLILPRPKDNFERLRQLEFVREHLSDSTDTIASLAEKAAENSRASDSGPVPESLEE